MKKRWKSYPKWVKLVSLLILFLIIAEIVLRFIIGLGDLAIYREDEDYEYIYAPDQNVFRFGNQISTNEYGMRSKKVNKKKKVTILEFGDSVLNGGAHVDQNGLASSIEERELNQIWKDQVQVLNVSAQSWGVSNAYAFLKKHGDFNASMIVLVFSSHDWNDNMHFKKVVGEHPAWPNEKPFLAITDAWTRFIFPPIKRLFTGEEEYEYLKGFDDSKVNSGWRDFKNYCKQHEVPLIVYLHASKNEIEAGEFDQNGQRIIKFCNKHQIDLITDLETFKNAENPFTDQIHLNGEGHELMAELLLPKLKKVVQDKKGN